MTNETTIRKQIEEITRQIIDNPDDPDLLNDLGVGYYLIGEYETSIGFLKKAVLLDSTNPSYRYNLANSYAETKQFELAIQNYLNVIQIVPDHIPALTNLADCYEAAGDKIKALELFTYVPTLEPQNALAHFNLGNFYLRINNHQEAARKYKKAIDTEPGFTDAYFNLAWILYQINAYNDAWTYIEKGLLQDKHHEDLQKLARKVKSRLGH